MDLRNLPDVDVAVIADPANPGTYTVILLIPGLPPLTKYDVPLIALIETLNIMRREVMQ